MWAGRDPNSEHIFHRFQANYDVVNTLQMELVHGRGIFQRFSRRSQKFYRE